MNETLSNYELVRCIACLLGLMGFIIMFKIIVLKEKKSVITEIAEFSLILVLFLCPVAVELYFNDPCKIDEFNGKTKTYECLDSELIQIIEKNMKHRSGAR
ncbi:hypothetical protein [Pseudomonas salomonii]|uniref:hypothetical protein n=1 Tax=Pseudomonas salomonii TaxID=191391 RepID=UPI0008527F4E|nr:hypothetical protein [Pseudomonas salomonii]